MITWLNGRLHLMCDRCFRRWPVAKLDGASDGRHLCDDCIGGPKVQLARVRRIK